jgi:TolB-like protein/class 3 adenylate cyclase
MVRRLAAVLTADVVGYSRLMGVDEAATLAALKEHRTELIEPKSEQYSGRTIKLMGDGTLMEFPSVVDAVTFAIDVQCTVRERNRAVPEDQQIRYRVGINIGDVIIEGDDIYGDGVNVAARLEALAEPGGICVARNVRNQIRDKLDLNLEDLGEVEVKNIARPVRAFRIVLDDKAAVFVTPIAAHTAKPRNGQPKSTKKGWLAAAAAIAIFAIAGGGVAWWQSRSPDGGLDATGQMAMPLPDKPSIAVLPFTNLSGDADQDYFVDGFTNAIITNLSEFPELFVIASNSVFTYKGKAVRINEVGRQLGVRYVLEGSFQRGADKISVHAQLIEAATETHVWAQQYDVTPEEIFAVQDDLSRQIATTLLATVIDLVQTAALRKDPTTLAAYELYLRASKFRGTKEALEESARLLERVIELDPGFDEAYSTLSWRYLNLWRNRLTDDPDETLRRAREAAHKAIALDQQDYRSHWALGTLYLYADQDHDLALAEYEKAISLCPNQADVLAMMSLVTAFMGRTEEAVDWIEKAKRLNPLHPVWYDWNGSFTYYMAREYENALIAAKKTIAIYPKALSAMRILAATYVEMGRMDDAKEIARQILEINPEITISSIRNTPFQHDSDRERYYAALHEAGLPN